MKQLLILGVLSFLLTTLLAQEYDGNVELNTAAEVGPHHGEDQEDE